MDFGATVRAILTTSCGSDLRTARLSTPLPDLDATERAALADHLERAFGITLAAEDVGHMETVRDVIQCVRLRRWTQRTDAPAPYVPELPARTAGGMSPAPIGLAARPRERLMRRLTGSVGASASPSGRR